MTRDSRSDKQQQAWGHESRFYASKDTKQNGPGGLLWGSEDAIKDMLLAFDPELPQRVKRAFKQWNLILRDYLRNETALRLSVGEEAQTVAVQITDGLPRPLDSVLSGCEAEVWLLLHRPLIEKAHGGLLAIEGGWEKPLPVWAPQLGDIPTFDEVRRTGEYLGRLALLAQSLEILERLKKINEDVLGAYFFRAPRPRIELYWMSIGLFAATVGVSPEALTVVVAAHELAHAYTHLGRDIDNHPWDTEAFAESDLDVVEGLAQFYTQVICDHLAPRMPEAKVAFGRLLELQPPPYTVHKEWAKGRANAKEIVRVSMIQARATGLTAYADLQNVLESQGKSLSG
jgi:hypothetical protein